MDRLIPETTALFVVDVQEKLAAAMPPAAIENVVHHTSILLDAARLLGVAVVVSEQYPKGLGPTVAPLAQKLSEQGITPFSKMTFDACSDLAIARALSNTKARAVVVVGMESHVCVFQTARELVRRGYATYVVEDAVVSRREENRQIGLSLCEKAGAILTATETVVFDWLEQAGTDAFKAISKLVK
ncbi:MAG: isochorismatase family protein [Polyangiaceae bacterium]|nr:isochorismatase family protein [Polyangiaceae bacterium]